MDEFNEWLWHYNTPTVYQITAMLLIYITFMIVFILSIAFTMAGLWFIPVLVWLLLPSYFIVRGFLKYKEKETIK